MNKRPRKQIISIEIYGSYYNGANALFRRCASQGDPNYTAGYWERNYIPTPASFRRCIRALELLTSPEFVR